MAVIRPFRALRPEPGAAARVAAVPYDVVNRDEAHALAEGNPLSFLHVSRPEIGMPTATDPHADAVYAQAKMNFERLRREAPLVREAAPSFYAYRQTLGSHSQLGLAATFSVEEYNTDRILKHERTRKDKEDDRARHVRELGAQTGPVFLTYRDVPEIDREMARASAGERLFDFTAVDGVRHEAWRITETSILEKLFAERVGALYIADGHHRAAAASRAAGQSEDSRFFLAVAFPASQLKILPYHRLVKDLRGLSPQTFLEKLSVEFKVEDGSATEPPAGRIGMYFQGRWHWLVPKRSFSGLDVDLLQKQVLEPLLGISDPRTDSRIDFMGGIRGVGELARRVECAEAAVAFALHPTRIEQVMETSDGGGIMPPKSTWFEPKLRDGLFTHLI